MDISDGFHLLKDGNAWCAVGPDFIDLQQSPAGFGATQAAAVGALRIKLRRRGWLYRLLPALEEFEVHEP
jgi:hypothetical protein